MRQPLPYRKPSTWWQQPVTTDQVLTTMATVMAALTTLAAMVL